MNRPSAVACSASLTAIALAVSSPMCFAGASIIVPVSQDESVNSGFAEKNYADNQNRGGLFVGCDGTSGVARFYLQFDLPTFVTPDKLQRATLSAVYEDDLDRKDNGLHRIHYVAADDWSEKTINWLNQPGPTFGSAEALFDSASAKLGDTEQWDLTELVRGELKGDDKLSLMFAASNESIERANRNWEYFAEHEYNPDHAFKLTLAVNSRVGGGNGGGAVAVPLPPAVWPAVFTFGGVTLLPMLKRMRKLRYEK